MALSDAADRRVAGHLANRCQRVRQQQGLRPDARRRSGRLTSRMAATNDNDIVPVAHGSLSAIEAPLSPWRTPPLSSGAVQAHDGRRSSVCAFKNEGGDSAMADGAIDTRTARVTAEEALQMHASGRPGKLETRISKPIATARDLSLAYSPGVAEPCLHIQRDASLAYDYTAKGNMVAVVSNGTAVLGLGNLGAVAAKPVMEGKIALFKRFADIDGIDLEIGSEDVDDVVNAVRFLAGFGGINLEDIKAPECFVIEQKLRELMDIPVFHDDQHGTAIVAAAGLINACHLT